jgi:hypothetical protein
MTAEKSLTRECVRRLHREGVGHMTEAFPWDTALRYPLRGRDASYAGTFRGRVEAMDVKEVVATQRSPWQNPMSNA